MIVRFAGLVAPAKQSPYCSPNSGKALVGFLVCCALTDASFTYISIIFILIVKINKYKNIKYPYTSKFKNVNKYQNMIINYNLEM